MLSIAGLGRPAGAVEAAAPDAGEVAETFYEQRVALVAECRGNGQPYRYGSSG